jgi:hypothetical protein
MSESQHPLPSVFSHSGWVGDAYPVGHDDPQPRPEDANGAQSLPADANLVTRVHASIDALNVGPADAGLVGLAFTLARSIDSMDDETRGRMLGQTSGQLLQVLRELRKQAAPKTWSKWDEMKPGALAASRR